MKNVFLSFNLENDKWFVTRVQLYLKRQQGLKVFLYDQHRDGDHFDEEIGTKIDLSKYFVFFRGQKVGTYQSKEALLWSEIHGNDQESHKLIIELPNPGPWPNELRIFKTGVHPYQVILNSGELNLKERHAAECAADLAQSINGKWIPYDGLPKRYIFDYEKDIIEQFASPRSAPEEKYLKEGCPEIWPKLIPTLGPKHYNPLKTSDIGSFRRPEDTVLVDVRSKYHRLETNACQADTGSCCLMKNGLTFLEAGPREMLHHGLQTPLNVGILVTGGIAPGINAVIAGLAERHILYWREQYKDPETENKPSLVIHSYLNGFSGLLEGRHHRVEFDHLGDENTQTNHALSAILNDANNGGAMLGTSRYDELSNTHSYEQRNEAMNRVLNRLWNEMIDILYVIGGDGSMKAAHSLHMLNEAWINKDPNHNPIARPVTIVGIPKTMDNDILWVWQSFGFMSAVEKASECLRLLHTEAISNPRLCIIQLFGSDSGFTVSHAALASLQCDAALIPEMQFDMDGLFQHIRKRLRARLQYVGEQRSPYGMVIMAETAVPEDWYCYVSWDEHLRRIKQTREELLDRIKDSKLQNAIRDQMDNNDTDKYTLDLSRDQVEAIITFLGNERRVYGQTPDALRTVSLHLVSQVLQHRIQTEMDIDPYWKTFRVFTSEPRHLLRSSPPSANDIISGRRFGTLAVDNAMAGYSDFMISQWLTEYVLVPLPLVVLGRKRVPAPGIFWKSVLAKTEQGDMNRHRPYV
jgi:6-phosphofructokinase